MIPLVPFRRARLVGGACPIGERGQDAADGCPEVLEKVQWVPPTSAGKQRRRRARAGAAAIGVLGKSSPAEHPQ